MAGERHQMVHVTTWLTTRERHRVDAAGEGRFGTTHCDTLAGLANDLALGRADAALVSAALIEARHEPALSALVRGLPASPIVGLVAETDDRQVLDSTRILGRAGVRTVLDARTPRGWAALRETFDGATLPERFLRDAVASVLRALEATATASPSSGLAPGRCPDGLIRFLGQIFAPQVRTTKQLARDLDIGASTLNSRFARAGLPSPRDYLELARAAWAAHLGESPGLTITAIAHRLDASSPQSFGRTLRRILGVTPTEFRRRYTGREMLARFAESLITPYQDTLRTFDPLAQAVRITGYRAAPRGRARPEGRETHGRRLGVHAGTGARGP